jgi:hypothetical protein
MNSEKKVRRIDIFISSPNDVSSEREIVLNVISRLSRLKHISERFAIHPLAYEELVPGVVGKSPQTIVNKYMAQAKNADIFICILWHRLGTPVLDETTGKLYDSGTVYEFSSAYNSFAANGTPKLLLYRNMKAIPSSADLSQAANVKRFFSKFEGIEAEYKGFYKVYRSRAEFERTLMQDIENVLRVDFDSPFDNERTRGEERNGAELVSWSSITRYTSALTEKMIGIRYKEKYDPQYYYHRTDIYSHFQNFLQSDKTVMVVTGKAGTGKSSFVCGVTMIPQDDLIVWLQDCAHLELENDMSIEAYIKRSLHLPDGESLNDIFDQLSKANKSTKIVFCSTL